MPSGNEAPYEVICGPAFVWVADPGEDFPVLGAAPEVEWMDMGWTDGGVTSSLPQNVEQYRVDQVVTGPVKAARTEESIVVSFAIVQLTLERYSEVVGGAVETVAAVVGPPAIPAHKKLKLARGRGIAPKAMCIRGPSPYGAEWLQWNIPLVFQSGDPEQTWTRDGMQSLSTEWTAMYDDGAAEGDEFGEILAMT